MRLPPAARELSALRERFLDHGLLLLRVASGVLIWIFHMSRKLVDVGAEMRDFPDPLGIGHAPSFVLALGAEGICSLLVAAGLATRLASLPVIFTMAMVLVLGARGFEGADVQSALLYAVPYLVLVCTGAGRWSIDHALRERYRRLYESIAHRVSPSRG